MNFMEIPQIEKPDMPVRVRFAPSPTGYLHLGGARTALYNWLFARSNNGKFILRIEDTDIKRSEEEYVQKILADLQWLGIEWDEGPEKGGPFAPYFQSERNNHYIRYTNDLLASGTAYYCFCKTGELEERRKKAEQSTSFFRYDGRCKTLPQEETENRLRAGKEAVVRFNVPEEGYTGFNDLIRKRVVVENKQIGDFIIIRSDGIPTYNFSVVVDDFEMEISHVIRGDDHISNTPKQILIYKALGKPLPQYAHIPMILGPDGARLSKRHGATAVNAYREMGYLPEAMINYLALLGWSFDDKQTIFSIDELIEKFSLKSVSKKAAIFDNKKLIWMNGVYLRKLDIDKLVILSKPYLEKRFGDRITDEKTLRNILTLIQPRMKSLSDVTAMTDYFWEDNINYEPDALKKLAQQEKVLNILKTLHKHLSVLEFFSIDILERTCEKVISELSIEFKELANPLRIAITGKTASPGLFEVLMLLGKKKVLNRIKNIINIIEL